jgi:hypothetical protein
VREHLTNQLPRQLASLLLTAVGCALGCTSQTAGRPETAPVRGRITYRGESVAGARVVFIHAGASRFASGQTDTDGRFQLTTYSPGDGAIVGKNVVIVVKRSTPGNSAANPIDPSAARNEDLDASFDRAASRAPARSAIPIKYANQKTSDLEREVLPGENNLTINLAD